MLTTDTVGGVWRYSLELCAGLTQHVAVTLVTMGPPPTERQRAEAAAISELQVVETQLPLDWLAATFQEVQEAARALAEIATDVCADAIQLHTAALVGMTLWPAPVIVTAHSCVGTWWRTVRGYAPLPPDMEWRVRAVARGLRAASAVIAPTESFASALRDVYGQDVTAIAIPNGRTAKRLPRTALPHALTAGRLWDEGKDAGSLDAAAAHVPILAAGPVSGPNGARFVARHLQILGDLNEDALAGEYAAAAAFVSAALYEPFGLAVLEAAQAGCALVLSDIPTFRELWDGAAIFASPRDARGLAAALGSLLQEPDQVARLGSLAQTASARFTPQRMVAATWAVHRKIRESIRRAAA